MHLTWRDARLLPEETEYEILDGDLIALPFPGPNHRRIIGNLEAVLHRQIARMAWGKVFQRPSGVVLSKTMLVVPDLFLVRKNRLGIIHNGKALGAPDLMVEIVSNSGQEANAIRKRRLYASHGVREFWMLSLLRRTVDIFIWSELGYIKAKPPVAHECILSPLLPMLRIPLEKIFSGRVL